MKEAQNPGRAQGPHGTGVRAKIVGHRARQECPFAGPAVKRLLHHCACLVHDLHHSSTVSTSSILSSLKVESVKPSRALPRPALSRSTPLSPPPSLSLRFFWSNATLSFVSFCCTISSSVTLRGVSFLFFAPFLLLGLEFPGYLASLSCPLTARARGWHIPGNDLGYGAL